MNGRRPTVFLCNGAERPGSAPQGAKIVSLAYSKDDPNRLVNLKLQSFVDQAYHLPLLRL